MTGIGTRRTSPSTTEPPGYWLTFDGVNDYIALPSSHGQEPTTALFIEMWLKNIDKKAGASHTIICRGNFYNQGYSVNFSINNTNEIVSVRFALDQGAGYNTVVDVSPFLMDSSVPIYFAVGWDGTKIYFFVQGMLLKTADVSGTLEYTGNLWTIGDMQQSSAVWPFKAKLGALRVSNICRHIASYTPPTSFVSDAYTIGLWKNTEGAGTTIIDSGPGGHTGTFKGAGEPAWSGEIVDLSVLSHGDALWQKCLDVLPIPASGSVWLHRIDVDTYWLYRKIHDTGPYWSKWSIGRVGGPSGPLEMRFCYTGIPSPANDTPSSWTTDPATELIPGAVNEYVIFGKITGGTSFGWGNGHGYETLDSETWTVDGTPTTLTDGQWVSGSEIIYQSSQHANDPVLGTRFVDTTKRLTMNIKRLYLEASYTFDWLVDWFSDRGNAFTMMCLLQIANTPTLTFVPGGTDYDIATGAAFIRAHAGAAWGASSDCILATHIDLIDGLRYNTDVGTVINGGLRKLYYSRTVEIDGAKAGTRWAYSCRWMALDNCGNHFLKTT